MSEILADARISDIFLYYGFDNGYVLNRFYGHTGLYGNYHPVKPSMVFFTLHFSLPPSLQGRAGRGLLSQENIHYSVGICHRDTLVVVHISCIHVEVRDA